MNDAKRDANRQVRLRRLITWALVLLLIAAFAGWIVWTNTHVQITRYPVSAAIPDAFDGYVVAQVSDLHNYEWGNQLIDHLKEEQPDLIVVTGDLVSFDDTDYDTAIEFIRQAVTIAPVYYSNGNHEAEFVLYPELEEAMEAEGVIILRNDAAHIAAGDETFNLIGLDDPEFEPTLPDEGQRAVMAEALDQHMDDSRYNLVLSHRPEEIDVYVEAGAELVLTGHTHGGQIRLPFIGGIYAPGQGFFPDYVEGIHDVGGTTMVISRGLGNSVLPFRFNNTPELVIVVLQSEQSDIRETD